MKLPILKEEPKNFGRAAQLLENIKVNAKGALHDLLTEKSTMLAEVAELVAAVAELEELLS